MRHILAYHGTVKFLVNSALAAAAHGFDFEVCVATVIRHARANRRTRCKTTPHRRIAKPPRWGCRGQGLQAAASGTGRRRGTPGLKATLA
jgi:hypothetical protein